MAGRQQPGFIERTVDELDEATDVRDFDNDDHIEGWALHKHEYNKRYQLSTCKLLRALIALSWLKWGDEYAGSLTMPVFVVSTLVSLLVKSKSCEAGISYVTPLPHTSDTDIAGELNLVEIVRSRLATPFVKGSSARPCA